MSKPLPLALLAAIAFANLRAEAVASAAIKVQAKRVNPIAIDGSFGDWKDVPVQYLFKGPRVTAIAHDERYLYVHFRFSDLSLARLVLRTGAIVWINGEARHEASFGLRYRGTTALEKALKEQEGSSDEPPNGAPGGGPPVGGQRGDGSPEMGPKLDRAPLGALEILHLGAADKVVAGGAQPDGAAAACGMLDGAFAYELRVPLAELSPAAHLSGANPLSRIAIGFQMGGLTPAELKAMREHMRSGSGPPGGGLGGGPSGGVGGGPPGGFGGGLGGQGGRVPPGGGQPFAPEGRLQDIEIVWVDVELLDMKAPTPGDASAGRQP
ncbi:MAG: hypothetical protein ABR961_14245 [Thermoanaerobaculaceae bacterium]|jgi:hypothetical protein